MRSNFKVETAGSETKIGARMAAVATQNRAAMLHARPESCFSDRDLDAAFPKGRIGAGRLEALFP